MSETTSQFIWLVNLLRNLRCAHFHLLTFASNNSAAEHIVQNLTFHSRTNIWIMIATVLEVESKKAVFKPLTSALKMKW